MTRRDYLLSERDQKEKPQKRQNLGEEKQTKRNAKHRIRSEDEHFKQLVEQDAKKRGVDTMKRSDGVSKEEIALFNQLMMLAAEKPGGFDTMKRSDGISSEEIALFNQLMMLAAEKRGGFDTMKRSDGISSEVIALFNQLMMLAAEK